jgi:signal transduction histidine kinase/ActR/RegA family two-component response regulator
MQQSSYQLTDATVAPGAVETAQRQARRLALLSNVAAQLLLHERPEELLDSLFEEISAQLGLEVFFNFLVVPCGDSLFLGSYSGVSEQVAKSIQRLEFGQAVCGTVARERQRRVVEDVQNRSDDLTALIRSLGITAYVCHPLLARGRLLGTLSFGTRQRPRFDPDEVELMRTVCDQLAAALERARLISELVDKSREAQEARAAAEAANRTKDEFLATLSHELRTPLTPVLLSVQKLESDPRLSRELRPELERMRRNVEVEARLIDDLLDLTRIARGKIQLHPEGVDVHGLLAHAVEICEADLTRKGIRLHFEPRAQESWVWGDPGRLEQIFWNLLSNGIKFTDPGGEVFLRTDDGPDGGLEVEVVDTGVGIDTEALPRIFDAFEQGGAQMTRRFGGLGLGLAISKALTDLHGGSIQARSEGRGRGAVFTVRLPTIQRPEGAAVAGESGEWASTRQSHILLVEDHFDTAEVLAEFLMGTGHRVSVAGSVEEALTRARAAQEDGGLDLVISDLGLPDGSGLDLMPRLKDLYGLKGIALSGYGMDEDLQRSQEAGFEIHLTKPVSPQTLVEAILRVSAG